MTFPLLPLPDSVQIEPVGQCNLRCRMCPIQFRNTGAPGQPPAFMDFDLFCRLVDQFPELRELHLQGLGEPMLHPRFFDMIRYAAARGILVSSNTNMTVMTEAQAYACIDSGLGVLCVSLDGARPETFEAIRVKAHFSSVLRNLRRLTAAKQARASERPELSLTAVVMRENLEELPELVRLAHGEGITALSVQHLCHDFGESSLPERYRPMRTFVDEQTLLHEEPQRVAHFFEAARAEAKRLQIALRLPKVEPRPHPPGTPGRQRCDWPWSASYISYDGKAMPCCMVATPDRIHFGDVAQDGVASVWNNREYQHFRDQLSSEDPPEVCRSCALYAGTF